MTASGSTPGAADPVAMPAAAQALLASATRLDTPCGQGSLVWHAWGPADGAPLVLLHGGSGSWTHWLRNVASLAATGRRLYIPDLPGFGDSAQPPGGQDADAIVAPLEAGLQQLLGDAAVDLAGFSFGGMVGGFLAAQHPARVRRLVLVGAPGLGIRLDPPLVLKGWRHLPTPDMQQAAHHHNLATLMLHDPRAIDALALQIQAANVWRDRMTRRSLARTDALARALATVACPTHAIYGSQDALYRAALPRLRAVLQAQPAFAGLQLIAGAGHWVQYEQPDAFHAALLPLLASAP